MSYSHSEKIDVLGFSDGLTMTADVAFSTDATNLDYRKFWGFFTEVIGTEPHYVVANQY